MGNLKEEIEKYEPTSIKNIADLESVPVSVEMEERTYKEGTPDAFTVKVAIVDGEAYRVPIPVIADLKAILEKKPELTHFAVTKNGQGLNTTYTVIPL